jgi:hypothetical protein
MSDTSTSTSAPAIDTYLDSLEDYFGVEMTLEDFLDIDDLDSFFAQLILDAAAAGKEVDFDAFESDFEDEVKDTHAYLYEQASELQAIIDSEGSTVSQVAQAELLHEEIMELDALADDDGENYLLDAWDDGQTLSAELSQTITEGESTTISPDDPQNGQNYSVTIESADDSSSGSSMNDETNANDADLDGDGYKETHWDTDGDGVLSTEEADAEAASDFDGDGNIETVGEEMSGLKDGGEITAADFTHTGDTDTTITIDLEEGDTLELSSWDDSTLTAMYKVTKEDGTVYYITLENVTEDTKIVCDTIPTNLDSMPDYISSKSWEFSDSQYSYYYFQDGHTGEYDAGTATNTSQAYIYLEDTGNTTTIEPSSEDFAAGKDYTVYCDANNADTLNLKFDDTTELAFVWTQNTNSDGSTDYATGTLVIKATDAHGNTITITLHDFNVADNNINITGGNISDDADVDYHMSQDLDSGTGDYTSTKDYISLADMIIWNGAPYSGRSESEIAADKAALAARGYPFLYNGEEF